MPAQKAGNKKAARSERLAFVRDATCPTTKIVSANSASVLQVGRLCSALCRCDDVRQRDIPAREQGAGRVQHGGVGQHYVLARHFVNGAHPRAAVLNMNTASWPMSSSINVDMVNSFKCVWVVTFSEKVKLTERVVAAAQPAPGARAKFYLDETLIGFGLAVSGKGSKSYFVMRRVNGRQVRYVFRRVGEGTVAQARVEASSLLAQMAHGVEHLVCADCGDVARGNLQD